MDDHFDPYYKWLGIPPTEQPANHYRLLGLVLFESDPDVIESAADRQMAHIRTFQAGRYSEQSQEVLNSLSAAKVCLLKPARKAEYDEQLRAKFEAEKPKTLTQSPQPVPDIPTPLHPVRPKAALYPQPAPVESHVAAFNRQQTPAPLQAQSDMPARRMQIVAAFVVLLLVITGWFAWSRLNRRSEQRDISEILANKTVEPAATPNALAVVPKPIEDSPEKLEPALPAPPFVPPPADINPPQPKPQPAPVNGVVVPPAAPSRPKTPLVEPANPPLAHENSPAQKLPVIKTQPDKSPPKEVIAGIPQKPPAKRRLTNSGMPLKSTSDGGPEDVLAAKWILAMRGTVTVRITNDDRIDVRPTGNLPAPPFQVTYVGLKPQQVASDAELANLKPLTDVEWVRLEGDFVTDKWLEAISQYSRATRLELISASVSDQSMTYLNGMTDLSSLTLEKLAITDKGIMAIQPGKYILSLNLSGTPITDAGLEHIAKFTGMHYLYLSGTAITDAGLVHLAKLPDLGAQLFLDDTRINGSGFLHLSKLADLKQISLGGTEVNDAGLKELAACSSLRNVNLFGCTAFTDAGLEHLQRLGKLESLVLSGSKITDDGLKHLPPIKLLNYLNLSGTAVTDEGLKHLVECVNLRGIGLTECGAITDAGLEHLHALQGLKRLYVGKTAVTEAGKQKLKAALPTCNIQN